MNLESAKAVASAVGWLSKQAADFRAELLRHASLRSYKKGEAIFHLGDDPGMMFCVVEGAVLVGVLHPIVGLYHGHLGRPGDWFGEAAALFRVNRRVSIEAVDDVSIVSLSFTTVREMVEQRTSWSLPMFSLLLWNQETAVRTAIDLLVHDPLERVCARLLTLCGARGEKDIPTGPIELPLTQDQFAMMCGLSRKSVHRALNALETKSMCELRYGAILVTQPHRILQMLIEASSRDS